MTLTTISYAQAGEVLRLKAGPVATEAKSKQVFFKTLRGVRHVVVQFNSRITAQDKGDLAALGAEVLR
ncbi:MAG: hypothetical protein V4692_11370, partial [Bdellovibrionota bacterium]